MGEEGEDSGSIFGGWGGQLLWKVYVSGVSYRETVEYDLAKTQEFLALVYIKEKNKLVYTCKKYIWMLCLR